MIARLPYWILTNPMPSLYEGDSKTTVEMTSKVYTKMQELIDDYNKFVDNINNHIEEYEAGINTDFDNFKEEINRIVHDYIVMLDLKIAHQDKVIAESITYITENIKVSLTEILTEMKDSGELNETILNSFDNLDTKIKALETSNNKIIDDINELDTKVIALENSKIKMYYDSKNETLYFENLEGEVK